MIKEEKRYWFALRVKPRNEFKSQTLLNTAEIDNYLPISTEIHQWSDRKKKITVPLIRGYIFVHVSERERIRALQQPGIINCVTDHGRPAKIPDEQIKNLQRFVRKEIFYSVIDGLAKGSRIRITDGPFKGVEGVILEEANNRSIAVSIELLNRTIITFITDNDLIEIIKDEKPEDKQT